MNGRQASYDSTALLAVRSTATIGLGIATGVMLSYPLVSWPSMYSPTSPHDIKGRLVRRSSLLLNPIYPNSVAQTSESPGMIFRRTSSGTFTRTEPT